MLRHTALVIMWVAVAGRAMAAQAGWESDLSQMGYLFLHLSNINVINGLNLTREQAVKLMGLARQVEAAAEQPPSFEAPMRPELAEVRKVWLEMREALLRGENPSKELRDRANACFAVKSKFVRSTVRPAPAARDTRCASCHQAPNTSQGLGSQPMTVGPALQHLVGRAHSEATYGKRGVVRVFFMARKVNELITDGQKDILGSFSCCIAPPEDLSNPMRAGQAATSSKEFELLRKVRECPDNWWPLMRAGILIHCDRIAETVSPGATAARKRAARQAVAKALDRARSLSEVEFEMEKAALVKATKHALVPPQADSRTKAAYFLLIPGASEVYARYIARLDAKAGAAQ